MTSICPVCGLAEIVVKKDRIYCSEECKAKAHNSKRKPKEYKFVRKCIGCESHFTVTNKLKYYCDPACEAWYKQLLYRDMQLDRKFGIATDWDNLSLQEIKRFNDFMFPKSKTKRAIQ
jgi:predicted nucleic acid-binding Zn ribbon protein